MATASQNTSLILNINGTPNVALKRGQKNSVTAKAGQRYRVVNEGEETAAKDGAKDVAASQQGQDLLLSYADGTQVALVNFYEACKAEQCAVDMPGAKGTGTSGGYVITGESPVGASLSDGSKLVYAHGDTASMAALTQGAGQAPGFSTQDSLITYIPSSDAGAWTPLHAGLGVLGATALLHHDGKAGPVPTVIHGSVVAGPVVAGNGLTAVAYKADGTVLASGAVNADGTFSLQVGNDYLGPLLIKVSDTNANPDYFDEATGAPKDLTTDLRALTVIPAAGTYNVSINVLTELAVRNLGLSGGDTGSSSTNFASLNQNQILQANQQIAATVGLAQDLVLGAAPVAIVTTTGASNDQSNDYGRLLAALSGAEVGSNTSAVLDNLVSQLQSSAAQGTGQVQETLLEGAAKVNLVAAVSDMANQKSTAITIDTVAQDNRLTPAEMIAGVQVQGTAAAGAGITLTWSDASGSSQATSIRTLTADSQGHWSTSFTSAEMPALGATTLKATVGTSAATRTIYLDEPLAPTITLTQVTGSNGSLTNNGHVDVTGILSGATWDYSTDGGSTWTASSGNGFTVTGDGAKQVLVRQSIGGHYSASSNSLNFVLDATAPAILSFGLATDSGSSASDGTTNVGTVNVTGLENGATWQYSTDSGTTWSAGTGTSFTLAEASYAAGAVKVRQSDASGNTSAAIGNAAAITIDATAPAIVSFGLATDSGSSASDGTTNVGTVSVTGLENGAKWQYSTDSGTTWSAGTGTSFTLAEASYAAGAIKVRQTDAAGNTSTAIGNAAAIIMDATAPAILSFGLATDSGSSASDGTTNVGTVNVTGLENGATWQYSTDSGTTWSAGTGTSFTLAEASYAAGAVKVRQSDASGNTSAAIDNAAAINMDATAPTVAIASSATSLGANASTTLTFTLSEAVSSFTANDVTVSGGTLSGFAGSGTSYTATFTPDAGLTGAATVSVASGVLTDSAGNVNTAASNTVSLVVDTLAPTVSTLSASSTALMVAQTATISITLSEVATDFTLADLQAVGGTLSNFSGSGLSYSATFTPDDNRTEPGSVSVTRGSFSDAALNANDNDNADGVVLSIQTLRPTATLQARQTKLGMGDGTVIDITLSEPSNNFSITDLTASHGTLSHFGALGGGVEEGTLYRVLFMPDANYTGIGSVTLTDGAFTNAAGNTNGGGAQPVSTGDLFIDTTPPTVTITSDVTALAIGQSATITFTFNKDPGDSFDAKDITVNGGTLTKLVNHTGTIWTAKFWPTDGSTGLASITVGAGAYQDAAGNQGTAGTTPVISIDTHGPVADSLLPGNATTVLPGHALVLGFDEAVHKGTGNIVLVDDTSGTRTSYAISDSAVVLSGDGKTLTITPTTALVAGNQYHVEADPASLLDAAGNAWAGIAASSTWAGSSWHFSAATPCVSLNKISTDNRVNGAENTAGVVVSGNIESNTAGMVADFVASDFTITLTPQSGGAITAHASNYNTNTGAWSLTLAPGALVDGKTYAVTVSVAGSTGLAAAAQATTSGKVLVDLGAAAPTLTLLEDTGSSTSDGQTSQAIVSVSGLENASAWEYSTDNGNTWLTGKGNQFKGTSTEGAHTVLVRQTDAAGNLSTNGSLSFTLDTNASGPVINAVATDDTINASEVGSLITGTAEAGATVQLVIGDDKMARKVIVTADSSGNWTHTLNAADMAALGTGQTQITAKQTDVAGNTSYTTLHNVEVDTAVPTITIEAYQTQLSAAEPTTQIRFTLSEKSTDFTASSVTVSGGTLSNFAGSGSNYTATFTPTNAATTAGRVSVAAGAFHDAAGNANAEVSNTLDLIVDMAVPTIAIGSNLSTLQAGDIATVTFTLSEASQDFGLNSVTVVGGTLGKLMSNAAGTVYTGIFTPTEGFAGTGSISVASNAFHDHGHNANADGADTNNTLALNIQGAPITLDISSDKSALKAGETATVSFAFSSAPTGFAASDITVAGGTLGALTTVDSTHYTATFTPTANAASGTASISVAAGTYTGASGNLGEGGKVVEISFDTLAPSLKTLNPDDNGYLAAAEGASLVATFSEAVLAGTGSIRLVDDTASSTTTYAITDSAIVIDGDKLTLTPSTALVAGHNYHLSIDNTALVDAAGNAYVGIANATSWNFGATNLSTSLNLVTGDSLINADEKTDAMAANGLVFSGTVSSVNPAVLGTLQASDIVVRVTLPDRIDNDGGAQKVLTFAATSYDSSTGAWTAQMPKTWQYTQYSLIFGVRSGSTTQTRDTLINGHTDSITVTVTGRAGTASAGLSTTLADSMTVDLIDPATPTLTLAGDTGSSTSDEITRNGLVNVSGLEAGGSWQYSVDGGVNWQAGSGSRIALTQDGSYNVQVKQSDAAVNTSASSSLAVTLDTLAKAPVVNDIATDNLINASEATSAITGTAEANASVSLVIGANTRTVTANSSGVWSYTLVAGDITAMGQGNEVINITQTDKAGNTSAHTSAVIEVDTVRPTVTLANTGSTSLLAGQSTTITATLSELPANFTESSFTVSGGVLSELKPDSTGLIYTGTFTPDADSTTAGSIRVAAGTVHDGSDNTNTSASNALSLTVNTVRPTVAVSSSVATGTTLHAGDTATLTFTLSAASSDFTASDVTVTGGTLSNFAGTGTSYTATYTPDANSTAPGSVRVANGAFANAAGNTNADGSDANNSVTLAIATARPTVTISSDLGTLAGGQSAVITFNFSEAPGSSFTESDITLTGGTLTSLKGSGTTYSAMFTPTAGFSGAASITVADGAYTNSDGSLGQAGATPAITIDAATPTVAISRSVSGTLGAGQTDTITFDFSEAPGSSFDATDVVVSGGTLGAISAVTATQYVATFTPTANAAGTAKISIASKTFADAAGNFNADGADANNTLAIAYATANITTGTVSASDMPTLSLAADTGTSATDHITNNGVVNVSGLVAGATWEYSTNGGTNWLAGTGSSFTLATAGTYSGLQVRQSDGVHTSNVGSLTGAAVNYQPNYAGTLSMALAIDGGVSATDLITTEAARVIVSGLNIATAWRFSTDNGTSWTTGEWWIPPVSGRTELLMSYGKVIDYKLLVEATDAAGNTTTGKFSFLMDGQRPAGPNVSLTKDPNDGGAIEAPTNIEPGATLMYQLNNGQWTNSYTAPTAAGDYTLLARQADVAGNAGYTTLNFSIAAAPATPIELSAVAAGTGGFVINGQCMYDFSGFSVSSAGDVNGDGLDDLIVGANGGDPASAPNAGRSYVVFGKTSGTGIDLSAVANGLGGFVINGQFGGANSGNSVSAAGDVNGDGLADLIVGASNTVLIGFPAPAPLAGASYVVFGKTTATGVDLSAVYSGLGGFVIKGQMFEGEQSGYSVSAAGDVNGDGLADLIVGARFSSPASGIDAGRSYVVFGKTSGTGIDLSAVAGGTGGFVINGQCELDNSGYSVSSAGDVNGDGLADLIVGAYFSSPAAGTSAGRSYVVFGKTSGTGIDLAAVAGGTGGFVINGQCELDNSGYSVSSAGDVNGDGLADLIVGANYSDPKAGTNAGRSYVVFGQTSGTGIDLSAVAAGVGGFVINGQCMSDQSGYSVSSAGDVNGDGLADLIVGARGGDPASGTNAGRSYVVFGQTSGTGIDLSAVAGGTGGFVINGQCAADNSGTSVSSAGDVNGDGLADLIVGAPYSDPASGDMNGRSYVIFGNTTGAFSQTAVDWLGTDGADTQSDDNVAQTLVAGAGSDSLTATAGSVLYGGADNDSFTIGQGMITALQSPMGKGGNVAQLARIDGGSGIDKIVLSGSGLTLDLTQVANQAGGNPDGGSRINSVEAIDLTGTGNNTLVLAARDVMDMAGMNLYNSGNGWIGLAASVPRHQLVVDGNAGDTLKISQEWVAVKGTVSLGSSTYKVYNAGTGAQLLVNTAMTVAIPPQVVELSAVAAGVGGFVINGQGAGDQSGISVSSAGDVNGDGLADLIVGAQSSDPASGANAGRSYVVFGKTSGTGINLSAVAGGIGGFVINGQCEGDQSGYSVSSAGDVNGDGLADLIVGAYNSDPASGANAGRSYVVFGKTSGTGINLSAVAGGIGGFVINGQCEGDQSGYSVSSAGDVNGDGLADLIVGAYASSPASGTFAGRSYVVFGKSSGTSINLSAVAGGTGGFVINGQCAVDLSGNSVSSAGDVNGDGLADLIVGAYHSAPASDANAGRSYVVFGKTSGTGINLAAVAGGIGGFVINGQGASEYSGDSVSSAGDVNGDGLADLIVGANSSSPAAGPFAGRSYVVFGKTSGTGIDLSAVAGGTGGFVINGQCAGDQSGHSVSSAGDVNGDGLADLIVGTNLANNYAGRSYVVFGKTSGTGIDLSAVAGGTGGFVINGQCAGDHSGRSVSSAGDVNGDGLADLIVGANLANNFAGRSYVIFGSTTGAFNQTAVDWMGTDAADTQSDGGVAKTLVAGAGNDSLTATAASVLYGGAGNDSFTIDQAMITALPNPMGQGGNVDRLARIDGGTGQDKIVLSGSGLTFDLTQVANQAASNPDGGSRIDSIEVIDITGSGNNALKLTAKDVLDMGSANVFAATGRQQLMVMGNTGDTLDLADGTGTTGTVGWTKITKAVTLSGVSCYAWNNDKTLATVYVQSGVVVG